MVSARFLNDFATLFFRCISFVRSSGLGLPWCGSVPATVGLLVLLYALALLFRGYALPYFLYLGFRVYSLPSNVVVTIVGFF